MLFSKSFGYALRGILYMALVRDKKSKVQTNEIALQLPVPEAFFTLFSIPKINHTIIQKTGE